MEQGGLAGGQRLDCLEGGVLGGGQGAGVIGRNLGAAGGAQHFAIVDHHPAFFRQKTHGGGGGAGLAQQFLEPEIAAVAIQNTQDFPLTLGEIAEIGVKRCAHPHHRLLGLGTRRGGHLHIAGDPLATNQVT